MPAAASRKSAARGRVAVVDIGSNSIRLVVFDRASRSPVPVFNEKVMCGLGRGLGDSGLLNESAVEPALDNLARFARLASAMQARRIDIVATAAVREARNGADFAAAAERRCGVPVRVLSGADEARLSALGVVCGTPEADGLMGDLGGGSLELVRLVKGRLGAHATLPLGPLRQPEALLADRAAARQAIDRELARVMWLAEAKGAAFYPVGGAWRTLARVHMEHVGYRLHVIHRYRIERRRAADFLQVVGRLSKPSFAAIPGVSRRRLGALPFAALLMERVLRLAKPERIEFSAYGLREGLVFSRLGPRERKTDPLLAACADWTEDRFGELGDALDAWIEPLFAGEDAAQRRLRLAICRLSDIAWRDHPDYRAKHAFSRILHLPVSGIDHPERVFAAIAVAVRYGGSRDDAEIEAVRGMLDEARQLRAVVLGLALRLAYSLSGATPALLAKSALVHDKSGVRLRLARGEARMFGEAVERRLEALGRALRCPVAVEEG